MEVLVEQLYLLVLNSGISFETLEGKYYSCSNIRLRNKVYNRRCNKSA